MFDNLKRITLDDGLDVAVQNGHTTDVLMHKIQVMTEYERMASDE